MTWETRVVRGRAPYALARALTATLLALAGATSAHTWAGGGVPTAPGLALVGAVVLAGSVLAFRRGVPTRAMLPLVAASQLGVHESFGLVGTHDHTTSPDVGWTWQMAAAHLFVTLLTAVLWWAGRRAASYAVTLRGRRPLPVAVRLLAATGVAAVVPRLHLLVPSRRGPPAALLPT